MASRRVVNWEGTGQCLPEMDTARLVPGRAWRSRCPRSARRSCLRARVLGASCVTSDRRIWRSCSTRSRRPLRQALHTVDVFFMSRLCSSSATSCKRKIKSVRICAIYMHYVRDECKAYKEHFVGQAAPIHSIGCGSSTLRHHQTNTSTNLLPPSTQHVLR